MLGFQPLDRAKVAHVFNRGNDNMRFLFTIAVFRNYVIRFLVTKQTRGILKTRLFETGPILFAGKGDASQ